MKNRSRSAACLLLLTAAVLARPAAAQMILTDGTFVGVSREAGVTAPTLTTLYGQWGSDPSGSAASGSQLLIDGWDTGGYNFVFTPGTIDGGTSANGANSGVANEAPGQYKVGGSGANAAYGNTYMWGANNNPATASSSGSPAIPAPPGGGNIIAADGAYESGSIYQTLNGLVPNAYYAVTFNFAGAQQQKFTGATTEQWLVALAGSALSTGPAAGTYQSTPVLNNATQSFTGWQSATLTFQATSTTEVLSFLANGTPNGEPPFALLADVSMAQVPEPGVWAMSVGFGGFLLCWGTVRRRRARLAAQAD